jgi:hypothetical protein
MIKYCFPINVIAQLLPRLIVPFEDSYMTIKTYVAIVVHGTNSNSRSVARKGNKKARLITSCFPINVIAQLVPRLILPFEDSYMTRTISVAIVVYGPNRNNYSIIRKGNGMARLITSCFSINVIAQLVPRRKKL